MKIHETAIVSANAEIGENTRIWQFCNIMEATKIGKNCNIGQGCFIESGVVLGNNVTVKNNVALYQGVTCEDDVFLGPNCVFTNVRFPRSFVSRKDCFEPTKICKGATIGANVTVVCGNTVGAYAMIGAGSVITKDVEEHALMIGNPAKLIGYVCECGEKLLDKAEDNRMHCEKCNLTYSIVDGKCVKEMF